VYIIFLFVCRSGLFCTRPLFTKHIIPRHLICNAVVRIQLIQWFSVLSGPNHFGARAKNIPMPGPKFQFRLHIPCLPPGFRAQTLQCMCCDGKARAASAQSFTLWQQATIEITQRDHSVIACSRHLYMGVVLGAHPVRGELHIQRNASGEIVRISLLFQRTAPTARSFCEGCTWHDLHILVTAHCVAIGSPSGMCAKLRTVAASNNRVHMP